MPDSADQPPATPAAPGARRVKVLAGWKIAAARVGGFCLRLWMRSLRVTLDPASRPLIEGPPRATLFVLWHNRLFIGGDLARRFRAGRPLHALISASKDGAWLSALFESLGLRAVRGSSSRGGREAASELIQVLRAGHDAGITPDGPRGPRYVSKPGALVVARRAGVRVVALGVDYSAAWRLDNWDLFYLPVPFSRVRLTLREIAPTELTGDDALARLERTLMAINPDARHAPAAG